VPTVVDDPLFTLPTDHRSLPLFLPPSRSFGLAYLTRTRASSHTTNHTLRSFIMMIIYLSFGGVWLSCICTTQQKPCSSTATLTFTKIRIFVLNCHTLALPPFMVSSLVFSFPNMLFTHQRRVGSVVFCRLPFKSIFCIISCES
jgi:hypothetical protein